ncbi:MAG TPA: glycosyltransferase [Thermoanaerobaculia bacterium]|nr:glycosyltransferase [Thermoanaerobaculia bacterium]
MPKPINVLFVITSSDFGGTESFLLQLVTGLDRARFRPLVVSLRPCGRIADRIAECGVEVSTLEMSGRPRIRELLSGARELRRRIDGGGVQVVHSLLYRANVLAAIAARWSSTRPRMIAGQRSLTAYSGWSAVRAARWTRRLCDRVVAVSEASRQALIEREHCDPARIVVIENGVDCQRFRPRNAERARRALGLSEAALVIGAIGRLSPKKGFHDLVAAVERLSAADLPVELVLVGEGPERARLEAEARAARLDGRIRFLGHRSDVEDLYAAFDVFVLPSYEEGSPNALLEAMASGCPVIATAVGGTPEILDGPSLGRLIAPGDPVGMAATLEELLRDPALRRRLGNGGRERVEELYELGGMIRRHEELYLALVNPSGDRLLD